MKNIRKDCLAKTNERMNKRKDNIISVVPLNLIARRRGNDTLNID